MLRVVGLDGRDLGRVRLLGIGEYPDAATSRLEQLAPVGSTLELTTDVARSDRDRYGRLLR